MLKRLILALTCLFLKDVIVLQLLAYTMTTIFTFQYIMLVRPNKSKTINRMDAFNEIVNVLLSYNIYIFTAWVDDGNIRYSTGWNMIFITGFTVLIHILVILKGNLTKAKEKGKSRWAKSKARASCLRHK